ncbi:3-methylitaconate isomerase [Nocardioides sp. KIGAM211]|uniref:3-methylitaconate isomerase n=1 Tax=Nocardioides luti TaxID=2761101 RepID=A0A7X0RFV8_9ACTN|nr:3-methylitaconate isomerase [Nocardioides luti]
MPFVIMRGGTSRGVFFRREDVPADRASLRQMLLDLFGSPDVRQIDGLGGADPLTSKAAVLGLPQSPGADVDYLHGQVSIREPQVDFAVNCGNLTTAAASLAITWGLVAPVEGVTTVRVRSVGTGAVIKVDVPVRDSRVVEQGDFPIAGVPGTGARIDLDFSQTAGQRTGRLFPTGERADSIYVPAFGAEVAVTVMDLGNLVTFVRMDDLGITAQMSPAAVEADAGVWEAMRHIRREVAGRIGFVVDDQFDESVNPMVVAVAQADEYVTLSGARVGTDTFALTCRQLRSAGVHKALTGSAGTCAAVASRIPGTVPFMAVREGLLLGPEVALGHPSGVLPVRCAVDLDDPTAPRVSEAVLFRTARRIAEGRAFLKCPRP